MSNPREPNLLLIGAQKSASTYLGAWLKNHPDIFVKTKEDYSLEDPEYELFNIDSLKLSVSQKYYAIRRPDYFGNIEYQKRLYKWFPNAKIIIVLRNPVDRAYSAYYHYMKYGIIPIKSSNYIHKIINGSYNKKIKAYSNLLEYGNYFKLITHLLNYYKLENILFLKQEEISNKNTFLKVAEFLEISNKIPERPKSIPQKSTYNINRLFIRSLYLPLKMNYDKPRSKAYTLKDVNLSMFSVFILKSIIKVEKLLYKNSKQKDKMSNNLRSSLSKYYKDDIDNLRKLNLIDVSDWK